MLLSHVCLRPLSLRLLPGFTLAPDHHTPAPACKLQRCICIQSDPSREIGARGGRPLKPRRVISHGGTLTGKKKKRRIKYLKCICHKLASNSRVDQELKAISQPRYNRDGSFYGKLGRNNGRGVGRSWTWRFGVGVSIATQRSKPRGTNR